jgi:hypothetical protein
MEHSLHLAAKHFVETVSPISSSSVRKKAAAALRLAREGGHLNMEEFDRALHSVDGDDVGEVGHWTDDDGNDDYDDDNDFTPGDALGKALALVKQVRFFFSRSSLLCIVLTHPIQIRMSPQARTFFKSSCIQVGIKPLELLLWIRTRWASLYKFLDRLITLRKVSNLYPYLYPFKQFCRQYSGRRTIHSLGRCQRKGSELAKGPILLRLLSHAEGLGQASGHSRGLTGVFKPSFPLHNPD